MTEKPKYSGGRPTLYTPELARLICDRIESHDIGTVRLCDMYNDMPGTTAIYAWIAKYPEFEKMYKEAKAKQAYLMADSLDDLSHEKHFFIDEKGNKRVDPAFVNDKRLRIDTRKWLAAKLLPKVYGEKNHLEELQSGNERLKQELQQLRAELDAKNKKEF